MAANVQIENRVLGSVTILYHPARLQATSEAEWLGGELRRRGIRVALGDGWNPQAVTELCCDRDLIVALGGDGTILHVARLAAPFGVPILGINLGHVGFLAAMTPESLHEQIDEVSEGRFWVERRTMLDVECKGDGVAERFLCLNEVAVARGVSSRAVRVDTLLDGQQFMTFTADGVLVATATGSTAYSLAAGGPILYPESQDFVITPVSPHLHIGRSILVPGDIEVGMRLSSDRPAIFSVDGSEERTLTPQHVVLARRSKMVAQFARLGPTWYFYSAIAERLH